MPEPSWADTFTSAWEEEAVRLLPGLILDSERLRLARERVQNALERAQLGFDPDKEEPR